MLLDEISISTDREILKLLGFKRTPEYGFSLDIIHSCTKYKRGNITLKKKINLIFILGGGLSFG